MSQPTLKVRILSPQLLIFEGKANSVSSKNFAGNFDILPEHANFLTMVDNAPIVVRTPDGEKKEFKVPFAIIYTHSNMVNIYTYTPPNIKDTLKH